ncbi:ATP-dependent DNA helicase RecG [Candidatus Dependentiae bacterium]|nr:ATP-dependent DNA helicase RecG [Candidatus Dependentiae bacterium]
MIEIEKEIQYVKGVGPHKAKLISKLDIKTIKDILFYFPKRYEDRRSIGKIVDLNINEYNIILGTVHSGSNTRSGRFTPRYELLVGDGSGFIKCVWYNQNFLKRVFKKGQRVLLAGKLKLKYRDMFFENPEYEIIDKDDDEYLHIGRITPIYSLTAGVTPKLFRRLVHNVIKEFVEGVTEYFPGKFLKENDLINLRDAIRNIHFPPNDIYFFSLLRARTKSQKRMIFDEFFFVQLGLAILKKNKIKIKKTKKFNKKGKQLKELRANLPFTLTSAQEHVIQEIFDDMLNSTPMNRLLQGDVGSGKTVVAVFTCVLAIQSGYQVAFMAPTEILASQHLKTITELCEPLGIKVLSLEGGLTGKKRDKYLEKISSGAYNLIIGTHSLIQEDVKFNNLGLIIIDEQHRFGVIQRLNLMDKSNYPEVIVMTATPIPRSYALVVYGDMDYSVLDELPPGRPETKTYVRDSNALDKIYKFIKEHIKEGEQAFFVYPLVDESEKLKLKDATNMFQYLSEKVFKDFKLGLIHGKMKKEEKDEIMAQFKSKELDILISTTVIEVGIDIPNATIMLIEHAERFGLAQLHQLRGRIGRGYKKSYCILVQHKRGTEDAQQRLKAMEETHDGFKIAEIDLEIRGPGEYSGIKQSGHPVFTIANLIRDFNLLKKARKAAFKMVNEDDFFSNKDYAGIRKELRNRWTDNAFLVNVV